MTIATSWIPSKINDILHSEPKKMVENLKWAKRAAIIGTIAVAFFIGPLWGLIAGIFTRDFLVTANKAIDILNKTETIPLKTSGLTPEAQNYLLKDTWVIKHIFFEALF